MKKHLLFSRFYLVIALAFVFVGAKAYDIEYAYCYKSVKIEFQSIDENNNPVTLSELVTIPLEKDGTTNRKVGFFVLSSMPFNTHQEQTATGEEALDANVLRTIATEGAMTVQVDCQGFGASAGKAIPFLINNVNARQSIDGLLAAMDYAKDNGITVSDDYYTINAGFSLDGGRAVAIQRYLEKYASAEDKARFRLRKTICGGAVISAEDTGSYILNGSLRYKIDKYTNLIDGFIKSKSQGALHGVTFDDLCNADSTLRQEVLTETSPAGKAFWKALRQENIYSDWTPETPITAIHFADDSIVTYKNAQAALNAWGHEKFQLLDRDMTGMKWNNSIFRDIQDNVGRYVNLNPHYKSALNFYAGMIDGCLRDTVITYGKSMNFYQMLTTIFDLSSGFNRDLPINISQKLQNGTLTIKTLGYLHFTGEIVSGTTTVSIDVTAKPEVKDSLASLISNIDAKGYLHLPLEFNVNINLNGTNIPVTGSCKDIYQLVQNLTACTLHHKCATEEEAKKYCNAFNENLDLNVAYKSIKGKVVEWYKQSDDKTYYIIEPHLYMYGAYADMEKIQGFLDLFNVQINIRDYVTIDNKTINIFGNIVTFHITDDQPGEIKMYADILKSDSTALGRVNFDLTPVNMNEDGTCETFNISFEADLTAYHVQLNGTCGNLNDAVIAAILCYGNLSCETEAQAQGYADAVNNNVQMELFIEKCNDDGTYPADPTYVDNGPTHASVFQDDNGAYYVQYCLNWMGKTDVPLLKVILGILGK